MERTSSPRVSGAVPESIPLALGEVPASGAWGSRLGSVPSLLLWDWRPRPSELRALVVAKFWSSVAPQNPPGLGGPRCQPRGLQEKLESCAEVHAHRPLLPPISEGHKYKTCGKWKALYTLNKAEHIGGLDMPTGSGRQFQFPSIDGSGGSASLHRGRVPGVTGNHL